MADIHIKTFTGFFLTFLGKGFLTELYKGFITHRDSGIYGAFDGEKLIGFAAYSANSGGFYKYLIKKSIHKFFLYSLLAFIKTPSIVFRLLRAFMYPKKSIRKEKYIELISIGVSPEYKKQNVGSMLMKALIENADTEKYVYMKLDTDRNDNDTVNHFYQKNGCILYSYHSTPEGREMNEYRFYFKASTEQSSISNVGEI